MARFGFRYDRFAAPIAWALGLIPQLTYVDVNDERVQVRIGPWFVLEAPRSEVAWADVARGDLPASPVTARGTPEHSALIVTTSKGPRARIRFAKTQQAKLLVGPPRLRPQIVLVNIGPRFGVDQISVSVSTPEKLVEILNP